jgi:hypothetical protein
MNLHGATMGTAHRKTQDLMHAIEDNRPERARVICQEIISLMGYPQDEPLKVHGYKPQSPEAVALVNRFKEMEERLLREIDALTQLREPNPAEPNQYLLKHNHRWVAIARTHFEEGFMALNRAVFQPGRIKLPEDPE